MKKSSNSFFVPTCTILLIVAGTCITTYGIRSLQANDWIIENNVCFPMANVSCDAVGISSCVKSIGDCTSCGTGGNIPVKSCMPYEGEKCKVIDVAEVSCGLKSEGVCDTNGICIPLDATGECLYALKCQ